MRQSLIIIYSLREGIDDISGKDETYRAALPEVQRIPIRLRSNILRPIHPVVRQYFQQASALSSKPLSGMFRNAR